MLEKNRSDRKLEEKLTEEQGEVAEKILVKGSPLIEEYIEENVKEMVFEKEISLSETEEQGIK